MKKFLLLLAISFICGTQFAKADIPFDIGIYTNVKTPSSEVSSERLGPRVGTATAYSILGLVTWGDCSFATAMRNGRITKAYGSDWERFGILGVSKKTFKVYGE